MVNLLVVVCFCLKISSMPVFPDCSQRIFLCVCVHVSVSLLYYMLNTIICILLAKSAHVCKNIVAGPHNFRGTL